MTIVNVHEAKTHLSRLLARIADGEEIIIARSGRPVARLVPYATPMAERTLGLDAGLLSIPDDFDAPLPAAILDAFEGQVE